MNNIQNTANSLSYGSTHYIQISPIRVHHKMYTSCSIYLFEVKHKEDVVAHRLLWHSNSKTQLTFLIVNKIHDHVAVRQGYRTKLNVNTVTRTTEKVLGMVKSNIADV